MIDTRLKNEIIAHAQVEYPREACGLIVAVDGTPEYWPCNNIATDKAFFIIDPQDYMKACDAGEIIAVVHSHPDHSCEPSEADRVACERSGLPWYIVSFPKKDWAYIEPVGFMPPLIGRRFVHGIVDCYTLIRDWYKFNRKIDLMDIDRPDEWWKSGQNLYVENFEKAGFREIEMKDIEEGDVILMQIMSDVPNHGAIYMGNNVIMHHLNKHLSCRDIFGGYYMKHTTHCLRYYGTEAN